MEVKDIKMTSSLLMAYEWFRVCPSSWKDRALTSLKNILTSGFTQTVATTRGQVFEGKINGALLKGASLDGILQKCEFLRGMGQQVWIEPLNITVDGKLFTFRGKLDYVGISIKPPVTAWKGKKMFCDLKTTMSVIKPERYVNSWQHIIYALAMDIPRASYLVYRFPDDAGLEPCDVSFIPIDLTHDLQDKKEALKERVGELMKFLKEYNLYDVYFNEFNGGRP